MGPASRSLKQTVTYWAPGVADDFGLSSFGAPTKLLGRWTEKTEQVRKANGEEVTSRTVVFLSEDVSEGGYLALGWHDGIADPHSVGAQEVQAFMSQPDLRFMEQERRAYL